MLAHTNIWGANIAVPRGSTQPRLIDTGRVAQNSSGADLLHFRRHYGADEQLWSDLIARCAEVFEMAAADVRTDAIA